MSVPSIWNSPKNSIPILERFCGLMESKVTVAHILLFIENGLVSVLTVRGILAYGADKYMNSRIELEDLAMQALTYVLHPAFRKEDLSQADKYALSDDYKRKVIPKTIQCQDCGMTGSGRDVLFAID